MLVALASSMIPDISEINRFKTGVLKDGSYAAVFSFVVKAAMAVGMLINGLILEWAGLTEGATTQEPATAYKFAIATFSSGPIVMLLALPILYFYPVDRKFMAEIKAKLAERENTAL